MILKINTVCNVAVSDFHIIIEFVDTTQTRLFTPNKD